MECKIGYHRVLLCWYTVIITKQYKVIFIELFERLLLLDVEFSEPRDQRSRLLRWILMFEFGFELQYVQCSNSVLFKVVEFCYKRVVNSTRQRLREQRLPVRVKS